LISAEGIWSAAAKLPLLLVTVFRPDFAKGVKLPFRFRMEISFRKILANG